MVLRRHCAHYCSESLSECLSWERGSSVDLNAAQEVASQDVVAPAWLYDRNAVLERHLKSWVNLLLRRSAPLCYDAWKTHWIFRWNAKTRWYTSSFSIDVLPGLLGVEERVQFPDRWLQRYGCTFDFLVWCAQSHCWTKNRRRIEPHVKNNDFNFAHVTKRLPGAKPASTFQAHFTYTRVRRFILISFGVGLGLISRRLRAFCGHKGVTLLWSLRTIMRRSIRDHGGTIIRYIAVCRPRKCARWRCGRRCRRRCRRRRSRRRVQMAGPRYRHWLRPFTSLRDLRRNRNGGQGWVRRWWVRRRLWGPSWDAGYANACSTDAVEGDSLISQSSQFSRETTIHRSVGGSTHGIVMHSSNYRCLK